MHANPREPVTIKTLRRMARDATPFACLTCYDATTARWLERAGVHVLLVGDTAAEMILGYRRTIDMPLEVAVALTAGVKRGAPSTHVMADMPFMSYQADDAQAIRNAGRFLTEGLADSVKIEADATHAPLIAKMARAGIPICAHVGSKPQQAGLTGGYTAAGRTPKQADQIIADAVALEQAGAVLLLIEAVPEDLTRRVMAATTVPLIGIGAGPAPHGQVLVLQDLLGLSEAAPPFARPIMSLGPAIRDTVALWVKHVADRGEGSIPAAAPNESTTVYGNPSGLPPVHPGAGPSR